MSHFDTSGEEFYSFEVTVVLKISMFLYMGISLYIGKTATFQNSITPQKILPENGSYLVGKVKACTLTCQKSTKTGLTIYPLKYIGYTQNHKPTFEGEVASVRWEMTK